MSMDVEYVAKLLEIVEGTTGHGGKLASIQSEALNTLFSINADLRKSQMAKAVAARESVAAMPLGAEEDDTSETNDVRRDADLNLTDRRV